MLYTPSGGDDGVRRAFGILLPKVSLSSSGRVDSPEGRPYNPPTADEAALQSANEISETFEKTKKFEISNGLLTGQNASNTTRHVDEAEHHLLPLSAFLKGQTSCRATGRENLFSTAR